MNCDVKVFIYPASRILYSSYYINGLYSMFEKKNVLFSNKYFKSLEKGADKSSYDHYMAFVVIYPDKSILKIIIDFRDKPSVKERAYDWADKYAKVNFNIHLTDEKYHKKIISIPPGFGIKIWNIWETGYHCISNLFKCRFTIPVGLKTYLGDYKAQYKRPALDDYLSNQYDEKRGRSKPYVFLVGTLWKHKNCIEGTNLYRKTFIELCQNLDCDFEGGFYAEPSHPQYSQFQKLIFSNRYSVKEYALKTKLSAVVFNTPAVHSCHGWKLGEFLAMGKAIISTPLSNQLPADLIHGKHIHIVSDIEELKSAINLILTNDNYRMSLENGAYQYYLDYANPKSVIQNILEY